MADFQIEINSGFSVVQVELKYDITNVPIFYFYGIIAYFCNFLLDST